MEKIYKFLLTAIAIGTWTSATHASTVLYNPNLEGSQSISANDITYYNVWSGVAQSVVALDKNVEFGFFLTAPNSNLYSVTYSLYEGDGVNGDILSTKTVSFSGMGYTPILVAAKFSDTNLVIGNSYTFGIEISPNNLSIGEHSPVNINYASIEKNYDSVDESIYHDGRFYFIGSFYDYSPYWIDRDIAFSMKGIAAVPEPAPWAMMMGGVSLMGLLLRRRKSNDRNFGKVFRTA